MTSPAQVDIDTELELDVVVRRREAVAEDVVRLELVPAHDGQSLPPWLAGAHIDVLVAPDIVRQYSLCGNPDDRTAYQIMVLLEPSGRGGSSRVHALAEGSPLRIRGPRNHFPLLPAARYLFIAGGIGITPILPMLLEAEAAGTSWRLVYGGRRRASMASGDELVARFGDRVQLCPQDELGLLDLETLLPQPEEGTLVYCCGPEPLLAAVEQRCAGWPDGSLHVERFVPKAQGAPMRGSGFLVELAASGREVVVDPGTSILEAVEAMGIGVLSSCREGICGTCETSVLAGIVDHRDSLLEPAERAANDTMMICVSRAAGDRLVLDL